MKGEQNEKRRKEYIITCIHNNYFGCIKADWLGESQSSLSYDSRCSFWHRCYYWTGACNPPYKEGNEKIIILRKRA